jgi:hypothetical protein
VGKLVDEVLARGLKMKYHRNEVFSIDHYWDHSLLRVLPVSRLGTEIRLLVTLREEPVHVP